MSDRLVRGINKETKFFACDMTDTVNKVIKLQNLSITSSVALGRLLQAGAMMGMELKDRKKSLTLQIQGDGPLGVIVVVAKKEGVLKGYVQNPSVEVKEKKLRSFDIPKAIGKGVLQVIKDEGLKRPYNALVKLQTSTIANDLSYYFYQSEQIPTIVSLGVFIQPDGFVRKAGGFIVQLLPNSNDITISKLEKKVAEFPNLTDLMDMGYEIETILEKFLLDKPRILETKPVDFICDCNKERFLAGINLLKKQEIENILKEDGVIKVNCHFCNKSYTFGREIFR